MTTLRLLLAATLAVPAAWGDPQTPPSSSPVRVLPSLLPAVPLPHRPDPSLLRVAEASGQEEGESPSEAAAARPRVRSPKRAFLFSALVPGAGELWAGSKMRAALFFGLEVLGWGTYVSWNAKGDDLEAGFRAFADTTWNPLDYLAWRDSRQARHTSRTHTLPCDSLFVQARWTEPDPTDKDETRRRNPADVIPEALKGCSTTETQQYYELIGKYDQFMAGWKDVVDSTGYQVHYSEIDSAENFSSKIRKTYEDQRYESNKYLKRAGNVAGLLLVNHVLSAIDAARVARARNLGQDEAVIDRRIRFLATLDGDRTARLTAWRPF